MRSINPELSCETYHPGTEYEDIATADLHQAGCRSTAKSSIPHESTAARRYYVDPNDWHGRGSLPGLVLQSTTRMGNYKHELLSRLYLKTSFLCTLLPLSITISFVLSVIRFNISCSMAALSFSVKRAFFYIGFISLILCNFVDAVAIKSPRSSDSLISKSSPVRVRQSNGSFTPVVGCGSVVDRRGVDDLQSNHADVFNMLLLALQGMQNVTENNDLSYYQISGIHGYPYVPWQEDPGFVPANRNRGYCTHSSSIFTTWHRPYLVLLEQLLCEQARSIAQQFQGDDAARYQAAAEEVRLPYWDWASTSTQSRIPASVKQSSISVNAPTGQATIPNPLFSYRFLSPQPTESGLGTQTVRGSSDDQLFGSFDSRRQSTLNLFTDSAYNQFSSDLENIHNTIHVQVGGHMTFVPRSAFDPIFYLHHTNVDRLTAMYQAALPGVTLTPQRRSPTFALGGAGPDDLSTRLYPFRHPNRNQWTSNDVANAESIFTYGYSYPEVPQGLSADDLQAFVTQKVNELYAPQPAAPAQFRFFLGNQSGVPDSKFPSQSSFMLSAG
jgi:Common central domain of tyrosinase